MASDEITVSVEDDVSAPEFMQAFLKEKQIIERHIEHISVSTKELNDLYDRANHAVVAGEESAISKEMRRIISGVNKRATTAKNMLAAMAAETARLKERREKPAELRIREVTHQSLVRKMVAEMREHQRAKKRLSEQSTKKCVRRARVVFPDKSEEQLQKEVGENPSGIFRSAMKKRANIKAQRAYEEARERAQDVESLERSVTEMAQMFMDLATLIEEQGDVLNSIEHNLDNAVEYVDKGNAELVKAHKYQKKSRKRMCCLLIIGLVLVIAIVVPVSTIVGA